MQCSPPAQTASVAQSLAAGQAAAPGFADLLAALAGGDTPGNGANVVALLPAQSDAATTTSPQVSGTGTGTVASDAATAAQAGVQPGAEMLLPAISLGARAATGETASPTRSTLRPTARSENQDKPGEEQQPTDAPQTLAGTLPIPLPIPARADQPAPAAAAAGGTSAGAAEPAVSALRELRGAAPRLIAASHQEPSLDLPSLAAPTLDHGSTQQVAADVSAALPSPAKAETVPSLSPAPAVIHTGAAAPPTVAEPVAQAAPLVASAPHVPAPMQVAAVISVSSPAQPGGPQHLTIKLDPAELGRVEVRIERSDTGPVHVHVAVERPDTLMTLLADKPRLEAALDQAGVSADGRTLQFDLGQPNGGETGHSGTGRGAAGPERFFGIAEPGNADVSLPVSPAIRLRAGIDITA